MKKSNFRRKSADKKPLKRTALKKPVKNLGNTLKKSALKKSNNNKNHKKNLKKKNIRKESTTPLSKEIKACDIAFSQYIRLSNADSHGMVKCYTCKYIGFWKQDSIECGHFRGRTNMNTRWLKINVACQCTRCNQLKQGNLDVFAKNLIRDYGDGVIEYLDRESKKINKLTIEKVQTLRNYFELELVKLKGKLNG